MSGQALERGVRRTRRRRGPSPARRASAAPSAVTMPALSWPRCCSAYSPRYVRLAASGLPKMPKTPHSSLNLSSICCAASRRGASAGKPRFTNGCRDACSSVEPYRKRRLSQTPAVFGRCTVSLYFTLSPEGSAVQSTAPYAFGFLDGQSIAGAPATDIRIAFPPVRPMSCAGTPASAAICSSVARSVRSNRHDHARRGLAEEGRGGRIRSRRPRPSAGSRRAPPPSRRRSSTRPASPPARRQSNRAPSAADPIAAARARRPRQTRVRARGRAGAVALDEAVDHLQIFAAAELAEFSPSRTMSSPSLANARATTREASSSTPTTPMTGVG